MLERMANAVTEHARNASNHVLRQVATHGVHTERQGQTMRLVAPPFTQIEDLVEFMARIRELPFVDEQARVGFASDDVLHDLVEGHDAVLEITHRQAGSQKRRGSQPRNRNDGVVEILDAHRLAGHEERPVAIPHAGAVREQDVAIVQVRVGVHRKRRDLELAVFGALIQGFDVLQNVLELEPFGFDEPFRERIEHERIIRIRAMSQLQQHDAPPCRATQFGKPPL